MGLVSPNLILTALPYLPSGWKDSGAVSCCQGALSGAETTIAGGQLTSPVHFYLLGATPHDPRKDLRHCSLFFFHFPPNQKYRLFKTAGNLAQISFLVFLELHGASKARHVFPPSLYHCLSNDLPKSQVNKFLYSGLTQGALLSAIFVLTTISSFTISYVGTSVNVEAAYTVRHPH